MGQSVVPKPAAGLGLLVLLAAFGCRASSIPSTDSSPKPGMVTPAGPPPEPEAGGPAPAAPRSAPRRDEQGMISEFDPTPFMAECGLTEPVTDSQLLAVVKRYQNADDRTLEDVFLGLGWVIMASQEPPPKEDPPRWNLPAAFAERLMKIQRPLLERPFGGDLHSCLASPDMQYLLMIGFVLGRMQHAPALEQLMDPKGIPALGRLTPDTWHNFGVVAFDPLLKRAREQGADRAVFLKSLGEIRDPAAIPQFQELRKTGDAEERAAAETALRGMDVSWQK